MYKKRHIITEENLVLLLKSNLNKGIEIVYDNYRDSLLNAIVKIVKSQDLAEDILQESFIKIWKTIPQYDSQKGRIYTWLLNVCRNTALDYLRSKEGKKYHRTFDLSANLTFVEIAYNEIFQSDGIGFKNLISRLNPEKEQIINELYFKGSTQKEASKDLALPLGTVKTRSRQALKDLRKIVGQRI